MSQRDRRLLLLAMMYSVEGRLRLLTQDFKTIQAWTTRSRPGTAPLGRLIWAANAAGRIIPGTTCLIRALTLQRLLSRNNLTSELGIGVAKVNDEFRAHAWLIRNGEVLIGGEDLEKYTILRQSEAETGAGQKIQSGRT
jgi:hypothetical protein